MKQLRSELISYDEWLESHYQDVAGLQREMRVSLYINSQASGETANVIDNKDKESHCNLCNDTGIYEYHSFDGMTTYRTVCSCKLEW